MAESRREHEDAPDLIEARADAMDMRNTKEAVRDFLVFWQRNADRGFVVEGHIARGKGCDDGPEFGGCCADAFDLDALVDAIEHDGLPCMTIEEAEAARAEAKRTAEEIAHTNRYSDPCPVKGCTMPGSTHQGDHVGADGVKLEGPPNPRRRR